MLETDDSVDAQETARRIEIEQDPMRWILDVLESLEHDADDPPPDVAWCESAAVSVRYGSRRNRESVHAVCRDTSGDRWSVLLAVDHDAGGYWEQPDSEIQAHWKLIREPNTMERVEEENRPAEVSAQAVAERPRAAEPEPRNDALAAFASARAALHAERERLMVSRSEIDRQIAEIDAVLSPAPAASQAAAEAPAMPDTPVRGPGSTAAIRKLALSSEGRKFTFGQVVKLVGNSSRAGALVQNMMRSGQVKKLGKGRFAGTDRMVEIAAQD